MHLVYLFLLIAYVLSHRNFIHENLNPDFSYEKLDSENNFIHEFEHLDPNHNKISFSFKAKLSEKTIQLSDASIIDCNSDQLIFDSQNEDHHARIIKSETILILKCENSAQKAIKVKSHQRQGKRFLVQGEEAKLDEVFGEGQVKMRVDNVHSFKRLLTDRTDIDSYDYSKKLSKDVLSWNYNSLTKSTASDSLNLYHEDDISVTCLNCHIFGSVGLELGFSWGYDFSWQAEMDVIFDGNTNIDLEFISTRHGSTNFTKDLVNLNLFSVPLFGLFGVPIELDVNLGIATQLELEFDSSFTFNTGLDSSIFVQRGTLIGNTGDSPYTFQSVNTVDEFTFHPHATTTSSFLNVDAHAAVIPKLQLKFSHIGAIEVEIIPKMNFALAIPSTYEVSAEIDAKARSYIELSFLSFIRYRSKNWELYSENLYKETLFSSQKRALPPRIPSTESRLLKQIYRGFDPKNQLKSKRAIQDVIEISDASSCESSEDLILDLETQSDVFIDYCDLTGISSPLSAETKGRGVLIDMPTGEFIILVRSANPLVVNVRSENGCGAILFSQKQESQDEDGAYKIILSFSSPKENKLYFIVAGDQCDSIDMEVYENTEKLILFVDADPNYGHDENPGTYQYSFLTIERALLEVEEAWEEDTTEAIIYLFPNIYSTGVYAPQNTGGFMDMARDLQGKKVTISSLNDLSAAGLQNLWELNQAGLLSDDIFRATVYGTAFDTEINPRDDSVYAFEVYSYFELILSGLWIGGFSPVEDGAAIVVRERASLSIVNSYFFGSRSKTGGSDVFCFEGAKVESSNNIYQSSYSKERAGGSIFVDSGCEFSSTFDLWSQSKSKIGLGGAICSVGSLYLFHSSFTSCSANNGGAVAVIRGDAHIEAVRFEKNVAYEFGGALYAEDSTIEMSKCYFTESVCTNHGSAIFLYRSTLTDTYSVYEYNSRPTIAVLEASVYNASSVTITHGGYVDKKKYYVDDNQYGKTAGNLFCLNSEVMLQDTKISQARQFPIGNLIENIDCYSCGGCLSCGLCSLCGECIDGECSTETSDQLCKQKLGEEAICNIYNGECWIPSEVFPTTETTCLELNDNSTAPLASQPTDLVEKSSYEFSPMIFVIIGQSALIVILIIVLIVLLVRNTRTEYA